MIPRAGAIRLAGMAGACAAVLLAGCGPRSGPDGRVPRLQISTSRADGLAQLPPVPAGTRLISIDAERGSAAAGALLEPAWCVEISARICRADGAPAVGVPVVFSLDRRGGCGRMLPAMLSDEWTVSDSSGVARTVLVSSDRPERCRVWASCGQSTLGAEVTFERQMPDELVVMPGAGGDARVRAPGSSPADLDERVLRLVDDLAAGGQAGERAAAEISAMGRAALPALLGAVYDERASETRRKRAARALAVVRDELVLEELIRALDDPRASIRAGAESALMERGPAGSGAQVRRAMGLAGRFGRASALRIVSSWGRPDDVATLAAAAASDQDPLVRATAVWRLRPFADRREAFAAMAAAIGDRSVFVRYTALKTMSLLPPSLSEAAAGECLRALNDTDPAVRAAAAKGCRSAGSAAGLISLLVDRDERVRRAATESLGAVALSAPEAIERLEALAGDGDRDVRALAASALVASGGRKQASRMLAALAGGAEPLEQSAALASLERVYRVEFGRPGPGGVGREKLAAEWSAWVREAGTLSDAVLLERAARSAGSRLRGEALLALVIGGSPNSRTLAVRALAGDLFASADPAVREPAAAALALLGDARGHDALLRDLASGEWPVRFAACRAAVHLEPADVAGSLAALLGDTSAAIRAEAHRALVRLAGRDLGFDPDGPAAVRSTMQARWLDWSRNLKAQSVNMGAKGAP